MPRALQPPLGGQLHGASPAWAAVSAWAGERAGEVGRAGGGGWAGKGLGEGNTSESSAVWVCRVGAHSRVVLVQIWGSMTKEARHQGSKTEVPPLCHVLWNLRKPSQGNFLPWNPKECSFPFVVIEPSLYEARLLHDHLFPPLCFSNTQLHHHFQ